MEVRLLASFVVLSLVAVTQGSGENKLEKRCGSHSCEWSAWGGWSECTSKCGCGVKTRCRAITKAASCGGRCDGAATQTKSCCAHTCCKKDCTWGGWTDWSECQLINRGRSCGAGRQYRSRRVTNQASCGGKQCGGPCEQRRACNVCCPKNCVWGGWGRWSDCSRKCGGGTKTRCRNIRVPASCDGTCDGAGTQTVVCNKQCCPRNAKWGPWGDWSTCSSGCAKPGWMVRTRKQAEVAHCGGKALDASEGKERKFCIGLCFGGGSSSSESGEKGCGGKHKGKGKCKGKGKGHTHKHKGKGHTHKGKHRHGSSSSSSESGSREKHYKKCKGKKCWWKKG